jgi:hypothetical protein
MTKDLYFLYSVQFFYMFLRQFGNSIAICIQKKRQAWQRGLIYTTLFLGFFDLAVFGSKSGQYETIEGFPPIEASKRLRVVGDSKLVAGFTEFDIKDDSFLGLSTLQVLFAGATLPVKLAFDDSIVTAMTMLASRRHLRRATCKEVQFGYIRVVQAKVTIEPK